MLQPKQLEFLRAAASAAVASEAVTGCPAALTLAQAIFESGWGGHASGFNCFGIKAHAGADSQMLPTTEWFTVEQAAAFVALGGGRTAVLRENVGTEFIDGRSLFVYACEDLFAKYNNLAEGFADHARLITQGRPYAAAWKQFKETDQFNLFVLAVGKVYATDPSYGATILSFATGTTVQNALKAARTSTGA